MGNWGRALASDKTGDTERSATGVCASMLARVSVCARVLGVGMMGCASIVNS
jgi:hypothetical protein